jgi:hypothetical protein
MENRAFFAISRSESGKTTTRLQEFLFFQNDRRAICFALLFTFFFLEKSSQKLSRAIIPPAREFSRQTR